MSKFGRYNKKKEHEEHRFIDSKREEHTFFLHLPAHGNEAAEGTKKFPLLFYMHGNGASNIATQGSKKTLSSEGMKFVTSEFIIATPFCNGKWKDPPGLWVSELLLRLRDMSCTDKERIYVTGYSKGGMGTWEISTMPRCAEVVAAIAPVCAYHIPSNS